MNAAKVAETMSGDSSSSSRLLAPPRAPPSHEIDLLRLRRRTETYRPQVQSCRLAVARAGEPTPQSAAPSSSRPGQPCKRSTKVPPATSRSTNTTTSTPRTRLNGLRNNRRPEGHDHKGKDIKPVYASGHPNDTQPSGRSQLVWELGFRRGREALRGHGSRCGRRGCAVKGASAGAGAARRRSRGHGRRSGP